MESIKGPDKLVDLEYGGAGHEKEYVLILRKNPYAEAEDVPDEWEDEIKERLGEGWMVMDRGQRIEIQPPNLVNDAQKEELIKKVVSDVFLGVKNPKQENVKLSAKSEFENLSTELDVLQKKANQGRGSQHITYIVDDLKRGDLFGARIDVKNQSDKFDHIPEIKDWIIKNLYKDDKHPWELTEAFYERLSQRRTIVIDTRLNQNQNTIRGIENKLVEKGYFPHYPAVILTATRFTNAAKFDTVDLKRPDEALGQVLTNARLTTHKNWLAKVVVRIFDQGQKEATVFLKPQVLRQNIKDNYDNGLFIWTESDGKIVAKAEIKDESGITLTFEKNGLPKLEESMEELNEGSNMLNTKIESDNSKYVKYLIRPGHNWNLAKRDILTIIDHWLK